MPLGQPAIPGVRTLALRDVQGAIDRIRERFTAVESQVATTTAQAGQTTLTLGQSNASISNLQRQVSALVTRLDALPTPTDRLETFIAAAAITQYDPVYVTTAGYVSPASATEINAAYGVIGVATTGAALGGNVVVRKSGTMQIAGAVFEPGGPVYLGLDGLTQFPDYVGVAIPVGVAVGTDQLDVTPGWPALQYPGVYSEFETFLPATWGLVRNAVELTDDFNSAANGIVAKTGFGDVSTRTLQQPAAGVTITNPAGIAGDPTFALANDLAALEGLASTGFAVRTGADTWAQRAVAGTADRVSVTNGNGVSGDPTVDIAAAYVGQTSITTLGTVATGVWQGTAVGATFGGTAQTSWATGDLLYASGANALAKRAIGATGDVLTVSGGVPVWAAPAASGGTVTSVDITQPAAGITATGGPITSSGSITLALADDLAALEGLGSTGLAARTAANTWAQRTVTGTSARITVTNGSGATGDPTVDIASTYVGQTSITTLGTITTGVWNGSTIGTVRGGTGFSSYTVGDILFALDATTLSKLPDVATGNALISGGVGVAPAYGKIGLTTHVAGVLPAANGGTGVANNAASTITISGSFASTFTLTGTTSVTFPTSGTLATTAQLPVGANPSTSVGLTAVNGSASTFMRSDGAPALGVGISPTWTGNHTFSPASGDTLFSAGNVGIGGAATRTGLTVGSTSRTGENYVHAITSTTDMFLGQSGSTIFGFTSGTIGLCFSSSAAAVGFGTAASQPVIVGTNNTERIRVDGSAGNVGLGTAAYTLGSALQLGRVFSFAHDINSGYFGAGWVGTSAANYAVTGNYAVRIHLDSAVGIIKFQTAPTGTGGNAVTFVDCLQIENGGQLTLPIVGKGLSIKEGANAKMGISTLVGGTVVVSNTTVTANSRIYPMPQNTSGGAGSVSVSARVVGTSFTISSTNVLDTRDVAWIIFEPS